MRIYLLACVVVFAVSCSKTGEKESLLFGKWKYEKITKNDTTFIEISQGDEMTMAIDHIFMYHLKKANKHEQGEWKLYGDTLQLSYQPHGKTRDFIIDDISETKLVLQDGEVYFYFNKEK